MFYYNLTSITDKLSLVIFIFFFLCLLNHCVNSCFYIYWFSKSGKCFYFYFFNIYISFIFISSLFVQLDDLATATAQLVPVVDFEKFKKVCTGKFDEIGQEIAQEIAEGISQQVSNFTLRNILSFSCYALIF